MKSHVIIVLRPMLFAIDAVAADLPVGNCAAPQAATDLSLCDFSCKKLAGRDLHGADMANADVWNASFDRALNRDESVQEALVEPFVVRERR